MCRGIAQCLGPPYIGCSAVSHVDSLMRVRAKMDETYGPAPAPEPELEIQHIVVDIYPKDGWPIPKTAAKDWDATSNSVTEACIESLGYSVPSSRTIELSWAYQARKFTSAFVVDNSKTTDLVLGRAACDDVKTAESRDAFPAEPAKKSPGESSSSFDKEEMRQWMTAADILVCRSHRVPGRARRRKGEERGASAGREGRSAAAETRCHASGWVRGVAYEPTGDGSAGCKGEGAVVDDVEQNSSARKGPASRLGAGAWGNYRR